jgi:hypothetical protein
MPSGMPQGSDLNFGERQRYHFRYYCYCVEDWKGTSDALIAWSDAVVDFESNHSCFDHALIQDSI